MEDWRNEFLGRDFSRQSTKPSTDDNPLAERGGFEPPIRFYSYNGLANRRFRPLSHLSNRGLPKACTLEAVSCCRLVSPGGLSSHCWTIPVSCRTGTTALTDGLYACGGHRSSLLARANCRCVVPPILCFGRATRKPEFWQRTRRVRMRWVARLPVAGGMGALTVSIGIRRSARIQGEQWAACARCPPVSSGGLVR